MIPWRPGAATGFSTHLPRKMRRDAGRDYFESDEQRTCNLEGEDVLIAPLTDILGLR
jgi:hypothetical protein